MTPPPPLPAHETERLARLQELLVLDTASEPMFDEIARMASEVCGTPIALISLVDAERQWFKANLGLTGVTQTPREQAFCAHAIVDDGVLEVPDANLDPRFADNPLVTAAPGIRFYAGAPLLLKSGARVGTLCVIDRQPRQLDAAQLHTLRSLSTIAVKALEMRRDLIRNLMSARSAGDRALADSEAQHRAIVEEQTDLVSLGEPDGRLVYVNPTYARQFGRTPAEMVGTNLFDFIAPAHRENVRRQFDGVLASGIQRSNENRMLDPDGSERWVAWTNSLQRDPVHGQTRVLSVGRDITERKRAENALRELTTILENTPDFVVQTDEDGLVTYMNPAVRRAVGLATNAPLHGRRFSEFNTAATNRLFAQTILPALTKDGVWVGDTTVQVVGNAALPVSQMVIAHRDGGGRTEHFSSVMRDISARVRAREQSQRQTATLRAVIEAIPAIVAVVGADFRFRLVNRAFEQWAGIDSATIVGGTMEEVLGRADFERSQDWALRALGGETVSFEKHFEAASESRHLAVTYVPLRLDDGSVDGFVSVKQDITVHRREQVRLLQLAQRDALTGLLNRSGFESDLGDRVSDGAGAALALLYIDLDHFKPVNDGHGHPVGDQLLRLFAQRLQGIVRPSDTVARLGGDEFAILLSGLRQGVDARAVADKVIDAAAQPFEVGGLRLHIGASVGVAFGVDPVGGWRDLIARADAMLYQAKDGGRGRQMGVAD